MKIHAGVIFAALSAALLTGQAWATCATNSFVSSTVDQTGPSQWTYNFSVQNGCANNHQQTLTDFYIPYFSDAGIADILLPPPDITSTTSTITWTDVIDPNSDLFNLAGAGVIDFQVTATPELEVAPDQDAPGVGYYFATGFSFTSPFAPVEGPYAILQVLPPTYTTTTTLFGDPGIPGSPDTIAALTAAAVPEPGTTALLMTGLGLIALALKKQRRHPLSSGTAATRESGMSGTACSNADRVVT
jgi:hypothetical protein